MRAISQFNYGVAKKCLNKASRLDADNINVMLVKGSLEFQFGNYEEAAEAFSQGLSIDPGNVELKNIYALVLSELQGRGEEAIRLMKEVIHDRPSARYFNNMGLIYSNVGQFLKDQKSTFACDYFEMAESYMDSALAAGISPAFGVNKGNYRLDMQDTVSARAFFNQYSNQFSINNQGIISELEGNRTQAVNYIEQAIQASEPYVCPIISLNLEKLNGQAGSQYKNEGPMLIYLYQIMPGILPDKHQFSYSFNMEPGTPVHHGGDYLVYSNLKGELMDDPTLPESAETYASK
jgi:tetratricopeptide (TPR) repeat protein